MQCSAIQPTFSQAHRYYANKVPKQQWKECSKKVVANANLFVTDDYYDLYKFFEILHMERIQNNIQPDRIDRLLL